MYIDISCAFSLRANNVLRHTTHWAEKPADIFFRDAFSLLNQNLKEVLWDSRCIGTLLYHRYSISIRLRLRLTVNHSITSICLSLKDLGEKLAVIFRIWKILKKLIRNKLWAPFGHYIRDDNMASSVMFVTIVVHILWPLFWIYQLYSYVEFYLRRFEQRCFDQFVNWVN